MSLHRVLFLLICLALWPLARAADPAPTSGPVPSWVQRLPIEPAPATPPDEVADGVHYLLVDAQVRVEGDVAVYYRRLASKALNTRGVEQVANVEIGFDPSYQALVVHAVNVRRGDRVIPKLSLRDVKVLQREKDLDALIYDGRRTAHLFLEDVRVDDVVEVEYSLRGSNPIFGGRHFGLQPLQWSVPVEHASLRLLWPTGRTLHVDTRNGAAAPEMSERGGYTERRWSARHVPALRVENDAPDWYDPYPQVRWSEFPDWQALARWAVPLYRLPEVPQVAVQREAARLAALGDDPRQRLLGALRFVQGEIRYLGVEVGVGSHAPSAPELVLQRRFGDCKDKTLLTLALLKALGIEADAALVHTRMRRGIVSQHPGPDLFNHAIVHVRLSGQDHWLDPTRPPQSGQLGTLHQPDYDQALLVRTDTRRLTPMARATAGPEQRHVRAVFDARAGVGEPARMTIETAHEGPSAESMRHTLSGTSAADLQKRYLNAYAHYYPGVSVDQPIATSEEPEANRFTVTERYLLPAFWTRDGTRQRATISVVDFEELLRAPAKPVRSAPLALRHPLELSQVTEVLLPEDWTLKDHDIRVEDPAFLFERLIRRVDARTVTVTDRYYSRAELVEPADMPRYVGNLQRAREALDYGLTWRDEVPAAGFWASLNWSLLMVGAMSLLLAAWAASRAYRHDPEPPLAIAGAPSGFGGWLFLLALVVGVWPLRLLKAIAETLPAYATPRWTLLTSPGSEAYHPGWAPLLLAALVVNLGLLVFSVLTLWLFFKRRSSAPRVLMTTMWASFVLLVADQLVTPIMLPAHEPEWGSMFKLGLGSALWTGYLLRSQRVRATFVRRLRGPDPERPAASNETVAPAAPA